ncbi:hypothetical protein AB0M02_31095 [Actinoplanes sp. NPDC051861]|uniref:hypothetical protein n=1 Tax=Actinoplanes sp. NPDC051861 TaxID=3155170 RepID=UPI0034430FBC
MTGSILSSVGPSGAYWLTGHDGVKGARLVGDRPFGVGLAAGLLAELVHDRWCRLWDGELFRTTADAPHDTALYALLAKMHEDEQHRPPVRPAGRAYVGAHALPQDGEQSPAGPGQTRPAGHGHSARDWMAYLTNGRAEILIRDRLAEHGLVSPIKHGLVFKTVRYLPRNSIVTGFPASEVRGAAERGYEMSWPALLLSGLYLATGLDQYALSTLTPQQQRGLVIQLKGLDEPSRELLKAAQTAVGDAAAVR